MLFRFQRAPRRSWSHSQWCTTSLKTSKLCCSHTSDWPMVFQITRRGYRLFRPDCMQSPFWVSWSLFPGTLWKSFLRVLTTDTSDSLQYIQTHSKSLPTVFCIMDWLRSWWMYCRSQTNSLWWENILNIWLSGQQYYFTRADLDSNKVYFKLSILYRT